jgi:hypothetical protein
MKGPDPEALMADLAAAYSPTTYTEQDRHRDFKALFLGSPQGRRVLYQILAWAHQWRPTFVAGKPDVSAFQEGERNVGLRLLTAIQIEPKSRPVKQNRKPSHDAGE